MRLKPFIKWAGGKSALISRIEPHLPKTSEINRYWEPFLGGGSLFFHIAPEQSVLSDLNDSLIDCYKDVRNNIDVLYGILTMHISNNSESYFYKIRDEYNSSPSSVDQSARFIYLNRTCFNGLYRENRSGEFNVPFGKRKNPHFPSFDEFKRSSSLLNGARIISASFDKVVDSVMPNDFVYFDPPYTVMHNDNGFVKYNSKLFSWEDQLKLRTVVDLLTENGVKALVSNAAHPSINELYSGYDILPIERASCISAKKLHRTQVQEYLIRNY